jgi:hypothetical protein
MRAATSYVWILRGRDVAAVAVMRSGYKRTMVVLLDTDMHRLVVTGPARDRLYDRFGRLFWGRDDVEVLKDRRVADRRRDRREIVVDRRSVERRRTAPVWLVPPS